MEADNNRNSLSANKKKNRNMYFSLRTIAIKVMQRCCFRRSCKRRTYTLSCKHTLSILFSFFFVCLILPIWRNSFSKTTNKYTICNSTTHVPLIIILLQLLRLLLSVYTFNNWITVRIFEIDRVRQPRRTLSTSNEIKQIKVWTICFLIF